MLLERLEDELGLGTEECNLVGVACGHQHQDSGLSELARHQLTATPSGSLASASSTTSNVSTRFLPWPAPASTMASVTTSARCIEHCGTESMDFAGQLGRQPGVANPGLAYHADQAARASSGLVPTLAQPRQLAVAPNHRRRAGHVELARQPDDLARSDHNASIK
jgi:hypothetical protein